MDYKVLNRNNKYLFLESIESREYFKVEYTKPMISHLLDETKHSFFNYIAIDKVPDTAIFGIPFNRGSRSPDSNVHLFADVMRKASLKLTNNNHYPDSTPLKFFNIGEDEPLECGKVLDLGNIKDSDEFTERETISKVARACLENRVPFLSVGGDHSYTYDIVSSMNFYNKPVVLWVLDAHNDMYGNTEKLDHGNVIYHIAELPFIKTIIQIGSRGLRTQEQLVKHPKVIQVSHENFSIDLIEYWSKQFNDSINYISIDLDSLDPQVFPFVDFRIPDGLLKKEVTNIIKEIFKRNELIVGADIVEGTASGSVINGDYDIPLEILILLLNKFYKNRRERGMYT